MTVDWRTVRADYPALSRQAYLDTACKGIPSSVAELAIVEHVRRLRESPARSTTDETIAMLSAFDRARTAVAALVGANAAEIALMPSTESGIAALAAALPFERGSNVVASDLEFIGTVLPWRFHGIDVKFVPHRSGVIELADLVQAIDGRTRAVVVSSVQEVNGFRVDLNELGRLCRERDVLLIVDAIQHVGPLPLDVGAVPVDAVAVGGHKWLGAPFGMGFTYVSQRILASLTPPSHPFMTAEPPSGGWSSYLESLDRRPDDALSFPRDARALESGALGTTLAAAGLAASVETLLAIGPAAIVNRSRELVAATVSALEAVGATIVTPRGNESSSIVTFRTPGDLDEDRRLVEALAGDGIVVSLRSTTGVGGIRVSPYFYNDEEDIDRLGAAAERALGGSANGRRPRRAQP